MAISLPKAFDMQGQRVLITGACGGLGRMMAPTLAELGADLALLDRIERIDLKRTPVRPQDICL